MRSEASKRVRPAHRRLWAEPFFFWWLLSTYELLYVGLWLFLQIQKGYSAADLLGRIITSRGAAVPLMVAVALAVTRNRFAHGLGLILLITWLFLGSWNYRIT
jgi:hypothetical protein